MTELYCVWSFQKKFAVCDRKNKSRCHARVPLFFSRSQTNIFYFFYIIWFAFVSERCHLCCAAIGAHRGGRTPYDENVIEAFVALCIYQ